MALFSDSLLSFEGKWQTQLARTWRMYKSYLLRKIYGNSANVLRTSNFAVLHVTCFWFTSDLEEIGALCHILLVCNI